MLKDRKWSYEKEYRIVFDKEDEKQLVYEDGKWFMPVKIHTVYLGVRFEENNDDIKNQIFDTCQRERIKVKRMVLSKDNYALKSVSENPCKAGL